MNSNDLKIFEAVAAYGSFTKAAEAMHTVQSNVTARIKNLEEEFGAALFVRTSRLVELTPAGETLMRYSKQIIHLLGEVKREIQSTGQVTGHLSVGCMETTMALKVPELIHTFTELYPDVELEFRSNMHGNLINDLLSYRLDAAFISGPVNIPALEQCKVKEERLVILASEKQSKMSNILAFQPLKIVTFDQGCVFRARLESWLESKGIVQYKRIVLNSIEGIINFVEAGLGISILPEEVISKYYPDRKLSKFPINEELGSLTTVLAFRKDIPQSRVLKAFIELHTSDQLVQNPF